MGHLLRSLLVIAALGSLAALSVVSCTAVDEQAAGGAGGSCVGPSCNPEDAGRDQIVADVPVPDSAPDAKPSSVSPLCGSGCLPDDADAPECAASPGEEPPSGDDAGDADPSDPDAALTPPAKYACVVKSVNGKPSAECALAGSGENGAPCVTEESCAPGLACVSDGTTAACRQYCCEQTTTCATGAFCAERPLAAATT